MSTDTTIKSSDADDDQIIAAFIARWGVSVAPDWGDLQDIYDYLRGQGRTLVRLRRPAGHVQRYLLDGNRSLTRPQLLAVVARDRRIASCAA